MGVTIDLILPETYEVDPEINEYTANSAMHPADEKLLEEEHNTVQDKKRAARHSQVI